MDPKEVVINDAFDQVEQPPADQQAANQEAC
jgi:hypothetical protein